MDKIVAICCEITISFSFPVNVFFWITEFSKFIRLRFVEVVDLYTRHLIR